eukprot:gene28294-37225_t
MKSIALEVGAGELPAIVVFMKLRPLLYKGVHTAEAISTFVKKQLEKPAKVLSSVNDVVNFINSRTGPQYSVSTIMVVGFFSEHEDIEEDDYQEYLETAKELQQNEDIYLGVVTNPKTSKWFKSNKTIDRTPAILIAGEDDSRKTINLDELYGERSSTKEWILKSAVPLVGKLTGQNFGLYEKLQIPMLMEHFSRAILSPNDDDLTDEMLTDQVGKVVGGKSGGIFNEALIEEFKAAAKEHVERIAFVYLDGNLFEDKMRSLGLYGGKERLPSIAFNTRDNAQIPFPEELPINKDTLLQFCADFISGKLRSPEDSKAMARKALQAAIPINQKNKAVRKERKKVPEATRGVSEQFGDGAVGDSAVVRLTLKNFEEFILNEDKDVVLLLHSSKGCESCAHFAVYFKRMAERLRELRVPTLEIARFDVADESPPGYLNLMVGPLPLLVMIPSGAKYPPWTFYSGVGKVQPMMKWVHEQSTFPFELPNLPHLSEKDKEAYKTQVREREEALEEKRRKEKREMEAEERAQKELLRKKRKQQQKQQQQLEESNLLEKSEVNGDGESQAAVEVGTPHLADSDEF